jgi:hypothetical protein
MFWIPVQGTNGWPDHPEREWWFAGTAQQPASPFVRFLASERWAVWNPADPFVWSTDVNGLGPLSRLLPGTRTNDWRAGGKALRWYLAEVPFEARILLAHSHGLQVVLEALADSPSITIPALISVGSPIRVDMAALARLARPHIQYWLHLHARLDLWQRLGQLFDGEVNLRGRWPTDYPQPDRLVELAGGGATVHGELLRNPERFQQWRQCGWLDAVEAAAAAF